jgi:hypothetical protein
MPAELQIRRFPKEAVHMHAKVRVLRSIQIPFGIAAAFALLAVMSATPALAAETKTLTGQKNCSTAVTISPPKAGGYCVITESSLKILEGSSVFYTDAHVVNHVLMSPVTLVALDERGSTATGECTYHQAAFYPPGYGLCAYTSGTGKLKGFHATIVVGPPSSPGVFSLNGTYWFDRDQGGDD